MLDEHHNITQISSISYLAAQHKLHKERLERIKRAAFRDITKQPQIIFPLAPDPTIAIPTAYPPPEPEKYASIAELILKIACDHYRVRKEDILSGRRMGNVVKARHAIIVMMYRFTKWTTIKIADKVNRDTSVVFYVLQKQEQAPIDYCELELKIQQRLPLITGNHL